MEQKYILDKDLDAGTLTIKEVGETDVSKFTTLHHESFALGDITDALAKGKESLVEFFRSNNFFPPEFSANVMAEGIISLVEDTERTSLKIAFSDNDSLDSHKDAVPEVAVTEEKEAVEVDALLDDDDKSDDKSDDASDVSK